MLGQKGWEVMVWGGGLMMGDGLGRRVDGLGRRWVMVWGGGLTEMGDGLGRVEGWGGDGLYRFLVMIR